MLCETLSISYMMHYVWIFFSAKKKKQSCHAVVHWTFMHILTRYIHICNKNALNLQWRSKNIMLAEAWRRGAASIIYSCLLKSGSRLKQHLFLLASHLFGRTLSSDVPNMTPPPAVTAEIKAE